MAITTSATTKLYVSASLPGTFTEAAYEGLSWTLVAEVNNIGQVGGSYQMIEHRPVDTGQVVKLPGSRNEGTAEVVMAKHAGADVTLLQTAFANRTPIAVKILYPTVLGTAAYTTAYVTSNVTTVGGSDSVMELRTTFDLASPLLEFSV